MPFPFQCAQCGKQCVSRTSVIGKYCGQRCMGLARRVFRPKSERVALKAAYDKERRSKLGDIVRAAKRESYYRNHAKNLRRQAELRASPGYRQKMRAYLATYWTPELKAKKKDYDRRFRAKQYGPLWEAHYLTVLLNEEVKCRMSNYELRLHNKTLNKALQRSRNGEVRRGYSTK